MARAEVDIVLGGGTMSKLRSLPTPNRRNAILLKPKVLVYLPHGSVDRVALSALSILFVSLRYKASDVTRRTEMK